MFRYYRKYEDFIRAFPRFKSSLLTFNLLKSLIPKIISWFKSVECGNLPATDVTSHQFWRLPPTIIQSAGSLTHIPMTMLVRSPACNVVDNNDEMNTDGNII
jgi:hypothetical protein